MGTTNKNSRRLQEVMAREAVPARKRYILVPTQGEVEQGEDGSRTLIFRLEQPYERYDFLLTEDAAKNLATELAAPGVRLGSPIILQ